MEFLVLGPLEVRAGRELRGLGGPRPRAVLAELLVHVGSVVSTASMIDDLWGAQSPPSAEAIVQNAISRLRESLGRSTIETVPSGYVLAIDPGRIDAQRFERLVREARPLPPGERAVALRSALALWRGPAYTDLAFEGFLQGEIARLDELRLTALEDRLEAELELGLHDRAEAELAALAAQEPERERLRRLQMLALHRSGRTQQALDVYEQVRRAIDEQSGLEPGAETKALQLMILRDDPIIATETTAVPGSGLARRPVALLVAQVVSEPGADLEAVATAVASGREALHDAVTRHGGIVAPSHGTESVAVFGAETASDDDVLRAGRAAIETSEMVRSRGVPLQLGLGVGRLLVERGVPLILGDVVDEVRHALTSVEAGHVVVTRSAADAGGAAFSLESRSGRCYLRGVNAGRPRGPFSSPLVGRDGALAHLEAAFRSVVDTGAPAHVVVTGEAGIGKTRLIREFAAQVDAVVLAATCVPYGEGITFLPLRELADQAESVDATAPRLGEVSSADEAFAGVRELLQHLARSGPVVVALDDLQWAMPTFLDLVEYIPLACSGSVLVVSAARPELLDRRPAWESYALSLEPLSAADTRRLIEALPSNDPLAADVVEQLVATSDGLPLFAEQLAAFAQTGSGGAVAVGVPPSLDSVLAGRLDSLTPGELTVMQHAAVIGPRFERAALAALADPTDVMRLDGRLAALERTGLLQPQGDVWLGFAHALVRDATYDGIPKAHRAELHERVARHLDLVGGAATTVPAVHLEAAARCLREAGVRRPALEVEAGCRLGAAGLVQLQGGDAPGAVNLLVRSRAMLEPADPYRLEVSVELIQALRDVGEHRQATAVLQESLDAARRLRRRRLELRVEVESIGPAILSGRGDDVPADRILRQALPVFRRARDDRGAGRALLVRAFLASVGCHFAEAANAAEEALVHLERAGYAPSAPLLVMAAAALHGICPIDVARDRCDELHRRAAGHALAQANVDLIRAMIEGLGGESDRARDLLEQASAVFEERGRRLMLLGDCTGVRAHIEILGGDLEAASAILETAADELERMGEHALGARHDALRAEIAIVVSEPASALKLVRRAAAGTPAIDLHAKVTCMRVNGIALAATGQVQKGRKLVEKALAALDGTDALELRSRVLLDLADVELRIGEPDAISAALDRAETAASAKGSVVLERRIEAMRQDSGDARPRGLGTPGPRGLI